MQLGAWPGGSWLPWWAAPICVGCFWSVDVEVTSLILVLHASFHLLTCKMGFAPIKRTCIAKSVFSYLGQFTDRTMMVDRQSQEKKANLLNGALKGIFLRELQKESS